MRLSEILLVAAARARVFEGGSVELPERGIRPLSRLMHPGDRLHLLGTFVHDSGDVCTEAWIEVDATCTVTITQERVA